MSCVTALVYIAVLVSSVQAEPPGASDTDFAKVQQDFDGTLKRPSGFLFLPLTLGYGSSAHAKNEIDIITPAPQWIARKTEAPKNANKPDIKSDSSTPKNSKKDKRWISPDSEEKDDGFLKTSLLEATAITGLTVLPGVLAYFAVHMEDQKGSPWDNFKLGFTKPPKFDGNSLAINLIGHPVFGSEAYLLCRNRAYHPLACIAYANAASIAWEYLLENWIGHPSIQDLIITPSLGSLLGELRFYGREELRKMGARRNTFEDIMMVLIDPNYAFYKFVEGQ
ncbi:MAG: DUF3943 domain-containing protein [Elusimicrobiota bacterium]